MSVRFSQALCLTVLLISALSIGTMRAQDSKPADPSTSTHSQVSFSFERRGLVVPKFQLTVRDDGTGLYEGEEVQNASTSNTSVAPPPQEFRRPLNISQPTVKRIFTLSKQLNQFNTTCTSKAKNIADTGAKILTYSGLVGVSGSCSYNSTDSKDVQTLTDIFQGIAETLDEGRKLDYLHRYDRLGLDEATSFLAEEAADGRALEIRTIAESLRSIASDSNVMERVRTRAESLLSLVPPNVH